MLKYLIIQLCDTSLSFCHYTNENKVKKLISLDDLKSGIHFGMKENLNIQVLYPDYELPQEYKKAIDTIDHIDIVSFWNKDLKLRENAEVIMIDSWQDIHTPLKKSVSYILRTSKDDLFTNYKKLYEVLPWVERINIVLTDISDFKGYDFKKYEMILSEISDNLAEVKDDFKTSKINILTDRMFLKSMNNCNAGDEVITLAPDGNFYVCPAFYLQGSKPEGNLSNGLRIRNPQLFKLSHAPICRECDAYQCKRCVWLNKLQTLEVNTPGREQCIVSHLERNQSRRLLSELRKQGHFTPEIEIKEIDYLDPFEIVNQ